MTCSYKRFDELQKEPRACGEIKNNNDNNKSTSACSSLLSRAGQHSVSKQKLCPSTLNSLIQFIPIEFTLDSTPQSCKKNKKIKRSKRLPLMHVNSCQQTPANVKWWAWWRALFIPSEVNIYHPQEAEPDPGFYIQHRQVATGDKLHFHHPFAIFFSLFL